MDDLARRLLDIISYTMYLVAVKPCCIVHDTQMLASLNTELKWSTAARPSSPSPSMSFLMCVAPNVMLMFSFSRAFCSLLILHNILYSYSYILVLCTCARAVYWFSCHNSWLGLILQAVVPGDSSDWGGADRAQCARAGARARAARARARASAADALRGPLLLPQPRDAARRAHVRHSVWCIWANPRIIHLHTIHKYTCAFLMLWL